MYLIEQPSQVGESLRLHKQILPLDIGFCTPGGQGMCAGHQKSLLECVRRIAGDKARICSKGQILRPLMCHSLELYSVSSEQHWMSLGRRVVR